MGRWVGGSVGRWVGWVGGWGGSVGGVAEATAGQTSGGPSRHAHTRLHFTMPSEPRGRPIPTHSRTLAYHPPPLPLSPPSHPPPLPARYVPNDEQVKALPAREEPVAATTASMQPSPLRPGQTLKAWREFEGRPQSAGAAGGSRAMSGNTAMMGTTGGGEESGSWTGTAQIRPRTGNTPQLMDTTSTEVRPLGERQVKNATREATVFGHVSAVVAAPGDATWRAYKYGQPRPTAGSKGMPGGMPPRPTTASSGAREKPPRPESAQPLRVIQHDVTTNVYRKKAPRGE